ncbi:family 1 encapsulin nanocompartment shell protein [Dermatobacter hominis]|uniref:family 1 encapsulin nanocompartment shell protein n=1 Tax=Dermatobacter hominis TaxID=2884263 RepID=UPI001D117990|nr:family 1 encapsulin nanocompartment shell protein [Dermatobacter hominis]UDY37854.1 bacteriocin family protein [Dermatobacter hominis]
MNHLLREKAPITEAAWAQIDEEATSALKEVLAGRRLLDVAGPKGWKHSAEPTGRTRHVGVVVGDVDARLRDVRPMVELKVPFAVARAELDAIDRGACDADLDAVRLAARDAAVAEDRSIFHGFSAGGIEGIVAETPNEPVVIEDDYDRYPSFVAQAVARLKLGGVTGPYAIALGPRCYTGVVEQSEMGGYPVLEHLRLILGGPVVFAPGVNGAVVMSLRGGDAEIVIGQDFSIGYTDHDSEVVRLYLQESFTLNLCAPEAFVHLRYED